MLFQVNCKGFRPYITESRIDAITILDQLKRITSACNMVTIQDKQWFKLLYKLNYRY